MKKALAVALCVLAIVGCTGRKEKKAVPESRVQAQYSVKEREWTALIAEYDKKTKELEKKIADVQEELKALKQLIQQQQKQPAVSPEVEQLKKRVENLEKKLTALSTVSSKRGKRGAIKPVAVKPKRVLVEQKVVREKKPQPVKKPPVKKKSAYVHLPAGAMAKATVLSGVYAPLSTEMPFPVALSLDEAPLGPNGSMVPLKHCVVFAKANGMMQGTRAVLQLVRLSCVLPTGKPLEVPVDGYVTDEDGLPGIKGKVQNVPKNVIVSAGISSFLKAVAEALAEAQTTVSVSSEGTSVRSITGSSAGYALAKGASGFLTPFASYYAKVTASALPVIVAPAGKKVYVFFRKGVTLEGYKLSYLNAGNNAVFRRLD